ncbi:MAG: inositol oxygenase family protein [Terriglobia bacterium]
MKAVSLSFTSRGAPSLNTLPSFVVRLGQIFWSSLAFAPKLTRWNSETHREGACQHLMNDDREMFQWVRAFNPYDLYSKSHEPPNVKALKPYYDELIAEYFPQQIAWQEWLHETGN